MSLWSFNATRAYLGTAFWLLFIACNDSEPTLEEPPAGISYALRGNQDVVVFDDGTLKPKWFGYAQPIGLCLDTPIEIDTSQWQVRLTFPGRLSTEFTEPRLQAGTTSCFTQTPPTTLQSTSDLEICATLRDGFNNHHYRLPCFRVAFDANDSDFKQVLAAANRTVGLFLQQTNEDNLSTLEQQASGLTERGYPLVGAGLRLLTLRPLFSEGSDEAHAEIRQRLDAAPTWSTQPAAAVLNAKLKRNWAKLALREGQTRRAWQLLSEADELTRQVVAVERLGVIMLQAEILGRLGAGRDSIDRLQAALDECQTGVCRQSLVAPAHQLLGWRLLDDPDASAQDLGRAEDSLATAGDSGDTGDTGGTVDNLERANQRLNAAFLAIRRGQNPGSALDEAGSILAGLEPGARQQNLQAWHHAFTGLAALAAGDAASAIESCAAAALAAPRIAARGWSCVGRAERLRGELDAAAAAFDQAILHHALAVPDSAGLGRPTAPGHRVDDSYRAARVAIERDDPDHAWLLLEALDASTVEFSESCDGRTSPDIQRVESRRHNLLSQLAWTEPPLAPRRQQQVAPVRRALLQSLTELQRVLLAACRSPLQASPVAADLRVFALDNEVISLWRSSDGSLEAQRTSLPRSELNHRIEQLAEAQRNGRLNDEAWRALAQPLADALLPKNLESLGVISHFALHGVLQRVPLPALPIPPGDGRRWLADVTTAVVRPPFVEAGTPRYDEALAAPLFVVDPRRNLPSGTEARDTYRGRFPAAKILFGDEASAQAVQAALPAASFLHVDAHGEYDKAFPELSSLGMADTNLSLGDLAKLAGPLHFANLSGCHTGFSRPTGGSGNDGLAGVLSRRGTRWVIAHQSAIEDDLGHDFNDVFYRQIEAGSGVVDAFRTALANLRSNYPAAAWSNLTLLGTADEGKNQLVVTTRG